MIVPTAANMKFKFPSMVPLDDGTIEMAIEEAVVTCGSNPNQPGSHGEWIDEANQTLAMMYYAAHLLQVSIMRAESGSGQIVSSERTPDLSITYAVPDRSKSIDFTMTVYGERFLSLARKNFPGVLTVNTGRGV